MSKAAEVWKTLSALDCSKHVEKKGNLSYLSWSWAWATLMNHYPDSSFEFLPNELLDNGTVTVYCKVTVDGLQREMWLPVMDHKNKSIVNPTSRDISDAKMRCLVKCLALFGLSLYLYHGEDLPEAVKEERNAVLTPAQLEEINKQLDDVQANKEAFCKLFKIGSLAEMKQSDLDKACDMIEHKRKSLEASNAKS